MILTFSLDDLGSGMFVGCGSTAVCHPGPWVGGMWSLSEFSSHSTELPSRGLPLQCPRLVSVDLPWFSAAESGLCPLKASSCHHWKSSSSHLPSTISSSIPGHQKLADILFCCKIVNFTDLEFKFQINKVLLEHNHTHPFICLWLLFCYKSRVESWQRPDGLQSINHWCVTCR